MCSSTALWVVAPPPRSLGVHGGLGADTGCGDRVEVRGREYVVEARSEQFRLERGRYVRSHQRLDVQPLGRWFLNGRLDGLLAQRWGEQVAILTVVRVESRE